MKPEKVKAEVLKLATWLRKHQVRERERARARESV
jgi:hypothetical protein